MPYSDIDDFLEVFPQAQGQDLRAEDALNDAADLVQRYAPAPAPLPSPDSYSSRAARAERRVAAYLFETGGYLSSKSGISEIGGSKGFRESSAVLSIVEAVMGSYYTSPSGNTGYIGTLPIERG